MIDNYNQVSVGLYAKLVALAEGGRDEADLEAVALLSGKSTDELLQMPIPDYTVLRAKAAFLYYEPTKHPLRDAYQCGPYKLVLVKDERKLTTAQYCDFQEYSKQEGDHLPEMLSVFLIPEGCTYNEGYDILDVQAAIRDNLCFLDAYAVADFFVTRLAALTLASLTYSAKTASRLKDRMRRKILRMKVLATEALLLNGVGSDKSMPSASLHAVLGPRRINSLP